MVNIGSVKTNNNIIYAVIAVKIMKKIICLALLVLLASCYGINEKNSQIFTLSSCCNSDSTWATIYNEHKIENGDKTEVKEIIEDFKRQPFSTDLIYFKSNPEEYVGISEGGTFVRYVYNKNISNQVLNGLSPQLKDSEKIRIGLRVNALLFNYLDEDGRKEAIIDIEKACSEFLKKNSE